MTRRSLLIVACCFWLASAAASLHGESAGSPEGKRLALDGIGTVMIRNTSGGTEGEISQLLLEKPGGSLQIVATQEVMDFVDLMKGDLDGDGQQEVIAVARNRAGDDVMPFIFRPGNTFHQVFPEFEEENPIIGKEISLIPGSGKSFMAVRVLVNVHDFGPPDLFTVESYALQGKKLIKSGEKLLEGTHFNQVLNRAGLQFQRGEYLKALEGYQSLIASHAASMPTQACVVAMLYEAESRKFLKDFTGALPLYQKVFTTFPSSPEAESAKREYEFISKNLQSSKALSLFIDASQLESTNRLTEALQLIEQTRPQYEQGPLADHMLFLQSEILVSLGRAPEAMTALEQLCRQFPQSALLPRAQELIQELQGNPDETSDLNGTPDHHNQDN
ncbi:MAG TPA: tetratricopeptide repeat protein [Candidatus Ozemobacteraceae bacterium]|nr:tetratricopeptide repeat protein [Candidatus Ozemobacteraceae bacterium]